MLPDLARSALLALANQLDALAAEIYVLERQLLAWHRKDQASQRLATIPGVGIITATALAASVPDPSVFRSGREFAAFLGLVPRQNSSGGKERLGRISKMGNGYLRKLLVVGATSVIRRARTSTSASATWINALRAPACSGRDRRHDQQECPHRLGCVGTRRGLPSADRSLITTTAAPTAAPNCKGARGMMRI